MRTRTWMLGLCGIAMAIATPPASIAGTSDRASGRGGLRGLQPSQVLPPGSNRNPAAAGRTGATTDRTLRPVLSFPGKLEVKEFSKEFEQWTDKIAISTPETLTFRWSKPQPVPASAKWVVTDKVSFQGQALPAPIAQGTLAPGGWPRQFEINFAPFIPKWPPASPGVYHYYVYVLPQSPPSRTAVPRAGPVSLSYKASAAAPTFTICTKHSDCSTGQVCDPEKKQCGPLVYICVDKHIIKGTDGSSTDCSPYRCVGNTCRTSCGSVDDCWTPFVCNENNQCIALP